MISRVKAALLNHNWIEDERHRRVTLFGILTLAFVLRVFAVLTLGSMFSGRTDSAQYLAVADNVLTQGVFGWEEGVPYAVIPPGYPLFIATVFRVTNHSLFALRLSQSVLGVVFVWLTYLIGKEMFSERVGLATGLICAVYPPFVLYVIPALTEALYLPLLMFYILYLIRSIKVPSFKHVALAGVGYGLSLLVKEALIAFPLALPLVFVWAKLGFRQMAQYLLIFAVVTLVIISPWLVRNYSTFGHVFYTERIAAIQHKLTGTGYLSPQFEQWVEKRESPPEDSHWLYDYYQRYGRTSDFWRPSFALNHPGTYVRYLFNRLVEYWLHPNGLESLPENLVVRGGYIVAHVVMLGLALGAIIKSLYRREIITGTAVLLLLYITMMGILFRRPNPRYNLPFLPLLFVFTAKGALGLVEWRNSKPSRDR